MAPFAKWYRKSMNGTMGAEFIPELVSWERFSQEIIYKFQGMEQDRQAVGDIEKVSYNDDIEEYLLKLVNLNMKARVSGVAWRILVEKKLPKDILRRISGATYETDKAWMEALRLVGKSEESFLKREKISQTTGRGRETATKRKRGNDNKGSNTKYTKNTQTSKRRHQIGRRQRVHQSGNIPIGKRHTRESLKN